MRHIIGTEAYIIAMNSFLLLFVNMLVSTNIHAQAGHEWDDPKVTSVNRELAHCVPIPMASAANVTGNDMTQSPYYQSLDGKWKFLWVEEPSKALTSYCEKDIDESMWSDIDVPSSWQIYGLHNNKKWDKPLYCNVAYPFAFDKNTYSVMAERPEWYTYNSKMPNPVGTYRRKFTVPENWKGRNVYVRFNGVGPGYYLWINGKRVGYSEDSYLPSEFDITRYIVKGENTIALQVYRFTSGSFLECQDYWRLTGIQRHCFIWSAPKSQIRDYFFTADLDDHYENATANVSVKLTNLKGLRHASVEARIEDNGRIIACKSANIAAEEEINIGMDVTNPKKWSAETPYLYDLVLTLKDAKGKAIDIRGGKVGFKKVSIRDDGALLINGKRMVFHGVNRHDFSPVNGRYVTPVEMEEDIMTMKKLNINAVRTSHYPNDPLFYDLCDKYGLYVLAEANVECHAYRELSSVELFRKAMVERSTNQVRWLRNHACIFMWSFGNESGRGENFKYSDIEIKKLDKTRLTHYEGNSDYADVSSTMYAGCDYIEKVGKERLGKSGQRPHIQCENSHSMGNSMGNVREFFDLYENYPCLAGEFIWDFKDQGILTKSTTGEEYWAYGGNFGDAPNDGNFCINGLVRPDWSLTSKSYNTKKIYQPLDFKVLNAKDSKFLIKNKMAFLPSSVYNVSYTITNETGDVLQQGTINTEVLAGDSAEIAIDLSATGKMDAAEEGFIYFCATLKEDTPWAKAGYIVAEEKLPVHYAEKPVFDIKKYNCKDDLKMTETDNAITLETSNFTVVFGKHTGTLDKYTYNNTPMIVKPLLLNTFRLPTDNDGKQSRNWDRMGLCNMTVKGLTHKCDIDKDRKSATVRMSSTYTGKGETTFYVQHIFKVLSNGMIMAYSHIKPSCKGAIIPKIGFRCEMPNEMEELTWFGRGSWDSYQDRKEACFPAIYKSTVSAQQEDYIMPQEHGTKQEVRWIALEDKKGNGLMFVTPDRAAASAVHFRPEDNYQDRNHRSRRTFQFKTCTNTIVSLDAKTRGLGNASCGPEVMEKYELKANDTSFRFLIQPISHDIDKAKTAHIDMPALDWQK